MAMERVYAIKIQGVDSDGGVSSAVTRLRALKYKMSSYVARTYKFPGGICATARGSRDPIVAHREEEIDMTGLADVQATDRRSYPVPYIDWSEPTSVDTTLVTDIYITHALLVRIVGEPGYEQAHAELTADNNMERHLSALSSVCKTAGFGEVRGDLLDRIRRSSGNSSSI